MGFGEGHGKKNGFKEGVAPKEMKKKLGSSNKSHEKVV